MLFAGDAEISLTEACTGYEGAYTELRTLLNTLT